MGSASKKEAFTAAASQRPGPMPTRARAQILMLISLSKPSVSAAKVLSLRWDGRRCKHCEFPAFCPCNPDRMSLSRSKLGEVGVGWCVEPRDDLVGRGIH